MKIKYLFLSFLFLLTPFHKSVAQISVVGKGWSQNSVNATVFRKNSVISHKKHQYVAYYDAEGFLTLAKRKQKSNKWEVHTTQYKGNVLDAHCSISLTVDGKGYLHVSWGHHNNKLLYATSIKPNSLELSEQQSMIGENENFVTYPEFYKFPNGDLFFLYRDGGSGHGNLVINRYHTKEGNWTRVHSSLIDGEDKRNAYWQATLDSQGTFHISWVWRETWDVSSNHDMCYAKTNDFGKTWEKSDGTKYNLPITKASAEYVSIIPQKSTLINQTSMYADANGNPYIATYFTKKGETVPQFFLIYKSKEGWKTTAMTNRKTPFTLGGGGTKKIPISRPQVIVNNKKEKTKVMLIYRDIEYDNKAVLTYNTNDELTTWETKTITNNSLDSWEPSYDTELWRTKKKLNLYVQKVGQGDGETLQNMPAQNVEIHQIKTPK
ncbi:BNR repeat-containing protein [Wenyingzhuangia marina]|uniref:BNR repeat-containing family member n=1 Tax=Wenyingzhuangia marina TaxID=1195760 RepID=A0A1M5V270_9FLAO|nr:BNR repeat-containing protein [Wenyingzhuangia marina]SHH69387.1 BNR repeat-containing family member [Wenyingzhuangia marina]